MRPEKSAKYSDTLIPRSKFLRLCFVSSPWMNYAFLKQDREAGQAGRRMNPAGLPNFSRT
ncbi:MAG: hypothetical protein A2Z83_01610 [Omnitrophica bacterium GWA2_52_8]|nr:MAG: hypothetical protein A2Z83_01610 [Omnitrophica bacterium GWA2_52_8]